MALQTSAQIILTYGGEGQIRHFKLNFQVVPIYTSFFILVEKLTSAVEQIDILVTTKTQKLT